MLFAEACRMYASEAVCKHAPSSVKVWHVEGRCRRVGCRAATGLLEKPKLYQETGQVPVRLYEAGKAGLRSDGYVGSWQSSQAEAGPDGQMAQYGVTVDGHFAMD
jgi:hypothetical protein